MRRLLPVLLLLFCAGLAHAQDTEIDQLKAEIKALQQVVMQLTTRLQAIESKLMIQQSSPAPAEPASSFIQPSISSDLKTQQKTVEYTIEKLLPKIRIDGNHAFEIKGIEVSPQLGRNKEETIYLKVLCTNKANEEWETKYESFRLLLDTGDLVGLHDYRSTYVPNNKIRKNERTERTVGFVIKNPQPELEGVLKIQSEKYGTSVDFKIMLKRKEKK